MRRKPFRALAAIAAAALVASSMVVPAIAATTYPELAGGTTTFEKYLVVPAGASIPSATFQFEAEAGTPISASTSDNTVMQVLAGPDADKITFTDAVFAPSDTKYNSVQTGDIDVARTDRTNVKFETSKSEQYAVKSVTADFSQVKFDEPGIYRYIIKEKTSAANAAKGIVHDDDVDRIMDVYVIDASTAASSTTVYVYDGEDYETEALAHAAAIADIDSTTTPGKYIFGGTEYDEETDAEAAAIAAVTTRTDSTGGATLQVAGYVMHTDASNVAINTNMGSADVQAAGAALADKTDGFTNEVNTTDLVFKKEVSGNQASHDKYFEFTLNLTGLTAGDKYAVSYADDGDANTVDGDADASIAANPNAATTKISAAVTQPAELTVGQDGTISQKFYLQHGQKIAVLGLPLTAGYTVTEDAEDYKSTASAVTGFADPTTGTMAADVNTSYLNTRDGVIPTGIVMTVIPGVAIVLAGIAGATMLGKSKRKSA